MYRAHTVSVGIACDPQKAYRYIADPTNFPHWAPGFAKSIEKQDAHWIAQTTLGQAKISFAPPNELGVLDHHVELPSGTFHNPMRVIPNADGCEVMFTVFQFTGVSDEQFRHDYETVDSDLRRLKEVLEHRYGSAV